MRDIISYYAIETNVNKIPYSPKLPGRCNGRRKMSAGEQAFPEELCLRDLFEESFGPALTDLWRSFHHWGTRFENSLDCIAC